MMAPEGFNRWMALPPVIAIQASVGSLYAWSIFNGPLCREVGVITSSSTDWGLAEVCGLTQQCISKSLTRRVNSCRWFQSLAPPPSPSGVAFGASGDLLKRQGRELAASCRLLSGVAGSRWQDLVPRCTPCLYSTLGLIPFLAFRAADSRQLSLTHSNVNTQVRCSWRPWIRIWLHFATVKHGQVVSRQKRDCYWSGRWRVRRALIHP